MSGQIRKAVIRRIAEQKRCSLAVAAHSYACMSITRRQALCDREAARQRRPSTLTADPTRPRGETGRASQEI